MAVSRAALKGGGAGLEARGADVKGGGAALKGRGADLPCISTYGIPYQAPPLPRFGQRGASFLYPRCCSQLSFLWVSFSVRLRAVMHFLHPTLIVCMRHLRFSTFLMGFTGFRYLDVSLAFLYPSDDFCTRSRRGFEEYLSSRSFE